MPHILDELEIPKPPYRSPRPVSPTGGLMATFAASEVPQPATLPAEFPVIAFSEDIAPAAPVETHRADQTSDAALAQEFDAFALPEPAPAPVAAEAAPTPSLEQAGSPEAIDAVVESAATAAQQQIDAQTSPKAPEAKAAVDAVTNNYKQKVSSRRTAKSKAPAEPAKVLESIEDEYDSTESALRAAEAAGNQPEIQRLTRLTHAYDKSVQKKNGFTEPVPAVSEPAPEPIPEQAPEPTPTPVAPEVVPPVVVEEGPVLLKEQGMKVGQIVTTGKTRARVLEINEVGRATRLQTLEEAAPVVEPEPIKMEPIPTPSAVGENPLEALLNEKPAVPEIKSDMNRTVEVKPGTPEGNELAQVRAAAEAMLRAREQAAAVPNFEEEFAQSEKGSGERLQQLDAFIADAQKVMEGAARVGNRDYFNTAGEMLMRAAAEARQIRARQEITERPAPITENADFDVEFAPAVPESVAKTPVDIMKEKVEAVMRANTPEERLQAEQEMERARREFLVAAREGRADHVTTIEDQMAQLRRDIDRGAGNKLFDTAEQKQEWTGLCDQRLGQLRTELDRVPNTQPGERARIEDDIQKLQYERDELNRPPTWFGRLKERAIKTYNKVKEKLTPRKSIRGFLAERAKGFGTLGFYEARQGERARTGTREVGDVIEQGAEAIRAEVGDNAARTRERNNVHIEATLAKAMALYDTKMANARTFMKGETALERRAEVETKIRESLNRARDTLLSAQKEDYVKVVRKAFDPAWQARYGAAALEAGLAGVAMTAGLKYIAGKYLFAATPPVVPPGVVPPAPPGLNPAAQGVWQNMHGNIWDTLRGIAQKNGLKLNNQQLIELSKQVITDTGKAMHVNMAEPSWVTSMGKAVSTHALPEGLPLKLAPNVLKAIGSTVY